MSSEDATIHRVSTVGDGRVRIEWALLMVEVVKTIDAQQVTDGGRAMGATTSR